MDTILGNRQGLRVLVAGSTLQLFLGIIYAWSVFVRPVSEFYTWDIEQVKLTSSFMLCCFVIGILAGGKLQLKIGASNVALIGGVMLALGMLATAFIPLGWYTWILYVTYGIIGGFGVGVGYSANIASAQKWFPKHRGFAAGVCVCAFGFSTVIFAPLVEWLIGQFGLRQTFVVLAGGFLIVVLALFRFIRLPDDSGTGSAAAAQLPEKKQYLTNEMLRTRSFYFITLSLMLGTAAFFILMPSLKTLAAERGLDKEIATVLVMISGVANALGRLGVPLLSDKIGRERAALTVLVLTMLGAVSLCFVQGFMFVAVVAVIAFCFGGYSGVYPVMTADYFGVRHIGANYGAVMIGFATSALVVPMVISQIHNETAKFIVLAALATLGATLVLILLHAKKNISPGRG